MPSKPTTLPPNQPPVPQAESWRFARFNLKGLLAIVAVLCLVGAHYSNRFHQQQQVVNLVHRHVGQIGFGDSTSARFSLRGLNRYLLPEIEEITLFFAQTSDDELTALRHCRNLKRLNLAYATVGDDLMPTLADLPSLVWLDLKQTSVSDVGLKSIREHRSLASLILDGTAVTDAGLVVLQKLPSLSYVSVRKTAVTPSGVDRFRRQHPTCVVVR